MASLPVSLAKGVATNMHARKIMALMAAFAVGFISLGLVLAEDPNPIQPPTAAKATNLQLLPVQPAPALPAPMQQSPAPLVKAPISNTIEELKDQPGNPAQNLNPNDPHVLIDAMCVQLPAGFCDESGLTLDNPATKTGELITSLSKRETKMLTALLRASHGRLILGNPKIEVLDGQTGSIQTIGPVEDVVTLEATTTNGKTVYTPRTVRLINSHQTLQVTPKIIKETGKISLDIDREIAQISEGLGIAVRKVERDGKGQTFETQKIEPGLTESHLRASVVIPDGETIVLRSLIESPRDKTQKSELLWVITAHLVRGKP
jgi:hypothetical protein